ncbi:AMP-dependent synthetase [Candidatus Acidianus copahuensis]|uniref:AMP-dependent synthetase n=1 Tax=Candidatus Acidianus copahuensis TaxID=1160895 RepID=A0A031LUN2_9CREN|nr:AMP-binding protein [Candidatus Acidianus copahuensis]EZQ11526.1 AMP-dependent synthetase [Candidatus Acidianus copahuensis]
MIPQNLVFNETVNKFKDKLALEYFDWKVTYGEMEKIVNGLAAQLSPYVEKGDRVALSLQNVPQFPLLMYAIWKLGGIVVTLNPMYTPREIGYYLKDASPRVIVTLCETYDNVRRAMDDLGYEAKVFRTNANTFHEVPKEYSIRWNVKECNEELYLNGRSYFPDERVSPDDVALLMYTSGTTGDPKGPVIRHKNIYASSWIYKEWFKVSPEDKALGIAPFFHITGFIFDITTPVMSGASIYMSYRFDPELALRAVQDKKTTITMFTATAYIAMLEHVDKYNIRSMRLWSAGGMFIPLALELEWKRKTGQWIYEAWGLTETTSPATLWPYPYDGELPIDKETNTVSAGVPVYYTQVKVIDVDDPTKEAEVGEILVKGPQVIDSYWNKPEATAKSIVNGWLFTGDVAKIINGWVYIIDRKKDLINASGYKIYPREVEEVLYRHPSVKEVAVVSLLDPYRGETVAAYITLKDGYTPSEDLKKDIEKFCRENLAAYKVPRVIEFVKEVPKTASGKIMRRAFKK